MLVLKNFRVCRIPTTNIDLHINFTWFIFLAVFFLSYLLTEGIVKALFVVGLLCGVYSIVVLHELGHCAAASYYGYKTDSIILFMFGGIAFIKDMENAARTPIKEIVIALAGPMVNIFLATVAFIAIGPVVIINNIGSVTNPDDYPWYLSAMSLFVVVNLVMAGFNLIPAFPLDGGRVLRGIIGFFCTFEKASFAAGVVGIGAHLSLIIVGFTYGYFMLVIISLLMIVESISTVMKYQP